MTHFGLLCPPSPGHLNPMATLGYELKQRGHRITMISVADGESAARAAGLDYLQMGAEAYPAGSIPKSLKQLGELEGLAAVRLTMELIRKGAEMALRECPTLIRAAGIEALLVDQAAPQGGSVAEHLGIPFISVANALVLNHESIIPPLFTTWEYDPSLWGRLRNELGYTVLRLIGQPLKRTINEYRQQWGLPLHKHPNEAYSTLAQITQQPAEFEFPRRELPKGFYFTGPFHNVRSRSPVEFPFDRLTGQPLIYASMGTVQNQLMNIFQAIAQACADLDAQLVLSFGGAAPPDPLPSFAGSPIVVPYAPQLELLQQAALTITHAGMNTTLESLSYGVPMVAIPITNDQPGVAARLAWAGAGAVVPLSKLNVPELRGAIARVLQDPAYREQARRLKAAIDRSGGVRQAADIIEQVLSISTTSDRET